MQEENLNNISGPGARLEKNTLFADPKSFDFKVLRQVYMADKKGIESGISNSIKKEEYLKMANIWVDAFCQTTGRPNSGDVAFTSTIDENVFEVAMDIIQNMRGYKVDKVRDVIVATFGNENSLASEVFIRFVMHPKIANMFDIQGIDDTTIEQEAMDEKDEILNNPERQEQILQEYFETITGVTTEDVQEEKKEEKPEEAYVVEKPALAIEDFSPKKMFQYNGLVDYDGKHLIIIGPDGERKIDEKPDEHLVKVAMLNRIWKVTCYNMEPDPSDERLDEIDATLFTGDNAIVLDVISKMLLVEGVNSVDAILSKLAQCEGLQNESIHKAYDFLSNLSQFGDMDLDFKGLKNRKDYIEMLQENQQALVIEHNPHQNK